MLCGEMYGAPYDLLAAYLNVQPDRLRGVVARWRAAGYAETGRLGPGPAWCWLTRPGLAALGLRFAPAGRRRDGWRTCARSWPPHRAAIQPRRASRDSPGGDPNAGSAPMPAAGLAAATSPTPKPAGPRFLGALSGERGAIEVELTPRPLARTATIMAGLLYRRTGYSPGAKPQDRPRYDRAVYLVSPARAQRRHLRRRHVARTLAGPDNHPRPAPRGDAVVTLCGRPGQRRTGAR